MSDLRPGYKRTEVGAIPEEWEVRPLHSVAEFLDSLRRPVKDADRAKMRGEIPYYGAAGIIDYVNDYLFDDDLVLVGEDGENILSRRLPVAFMISGKAWVNNHAHVLKAKWGVNAQYLAIACAQLDFAAYNSSTAQPKLTKGTCQKLCIPLPPFPEQQAITGALGEADALIGALEALIAKKRDIKQGAMQELLTGLLPTMKRALGSVLRVGHGRSQKGIESLEGAYPILASGGQIGRASAYLYDRPSVLIGRKGTIDRPQYAETPFWTIDTLFYTVVFEPNIPKYLFYKFCMIDWRQYNEASGVPSLNAATIENIEIELHEPEAQRAIAAVLSDVDAEIAALEDKLAKARAVKQGMMQVLLTGEVRLV